MKSLTKSLLWIAVVLNAISGIVDVYLLRVGTPPPANAYGHLALQHFLFALAVMALAEKTK